MDDAKPLEIRQSATSNTSYLCAIEGHDVGFNFLSAAKGRMDFTVAIDGVPCGKINVLSRHSIAGALKSAGIEESEVKGLERGFLIAGEMLRDGDVILAKQDEKINSLIGKPSSFGPIGESSMNEFLGTPDLLDRVDDILRHSRLIPFKGDGSGLLTSFLVILSCKTGIPLNLEIIGPSASGKTHLALTARNGFPKSMVMVLAGASRESLKYDYDEVDDDGNFLVHVEGKCIIVLEKDESSQFIQRLKPLMSGDDKELVFKTPIKNEVTGDIETRDFKIIGQPSFITLTTRNPNEWEQVTRQLLMTPETDSGKVKEVVDGILSAKARPDEMSLHEDIDLMQASIEAIPKREVRNIFAPLIAEYFPSTNASHQRTVTKIIGLIDALAILHHHQRPVEINGNRTFIMASIEDMVIGLALADKVLRASLSGVPDDTWLIFKHLRDMESGNKALTEDNILKYLHLQSVQMSRRALRDKHIETLTESGLLETASRGGGRNGSRKSWRSVKTQEHLMEQYELTPLFVDSVSSRLGEVVSEYHDILSRCSPPKYQRKPTTNERKVIDDYCGTAGIDFKKVVASLILPVYTRTSAKGNSIWSMMGESSVREHLFGKSCAWLTQSNMGAKESLRKRAEGLEKVRQNLASTSVDADLADDIWLSMLSGQFEDEGPIRKVRREFKKPDEN